MKRVHHSVIQAPTNDPMPNEIEACRGKSAYPSKQIAKEYARISARQGFKIKVYECRICRRWHLTSHDQVAVRERLRRWSER